MGNMSDGEEDKASEALFETKSLKREIYRVFAGSVFVGIVFIWIYRATHTHIPSGDGSEEWRRRCCWVGMFAAEIWFGAYWILTQSLRWNPIRRLTFPDRLSNRYEKSLPRVDIFVCTADASIEPQIMVMNTVLSVMAYDYPPENLSVYLSDDGGSAITLYALFEASLFAKYWLPYCRKFKANSTSPAAYFNSINYNHDSYFASIKKLYKEMEDRIEIAAKLGRISEEARSRHSKFTLWESFSSTKGNHDTILHILIHGRSVESMDSEGCVMPTLVYLAREKRPGHLHNFKAGALNALIRVSGELSNGPIILTLDCDMFSNNPQSLRNALCFLMDSGKGQEIGYVQCPQCFKNITPNDMYCTSLRAAIEMEYRGLDGVGGPFYIGTGCFFKRNALLGIKFCKGLNVEWKTDSQTVNDTADLQHRLKALASCAYEKNTQWGNEMGLKYGCQVEDVITGLFIQCQGWKSVYYNPEMKSFLGITPTTLLQSLVQHKRWSEGLFQMVISKYSPLWYGHKKIHPLLQMGYASFNFWAPTSFAIIYYSLVPPLCLLKGIPLFPQISSPWFLAFAYVMVSRILGSLVESMRCGSSVLRWWNAQRMWLYRRQSSYLFACMDMGSNLLGLSKSTFEVTSKVCDDEEVLRRYEEEVMEFGDSSPMFTVLSTIAILNLMCLGGAAMRRREAMGMMVLEAAICAMLVVINLPLYGGLFFRRDSGRMPKAVVLKALGLASLLIVCFVGVD